MSTGYQILLGFFTGYLLIGEVVLSRIFFGTFFYITKRTFGWAL